MEEHVLKDLSLYDIAFSVALTESHFNRLFKKETGITPIKFFEKLKMEKAFLDLIENNDQVIDLSIKYGYKNYETFSRAFKKYHGVSPDDLRKILVKLCEHYGITNISKDLIVVSNKTDDKAALANKIIQKAEERGLEIPSNEKITTFIVKRSELATGEPDEQQILQKYIAQRSEQLWETVLSKVQHQK